MSSITYLLFDRFTAWPAQKRLDNVGTYSGGESVFGDRKTIVAYHSAHRPRRRFAKKIPLGASREQICS